MPGILKNESLMAENNSRILKWFLWLSNFDYEIIYKPGYLNYLADMLTRESAQERPPALNMFSSGASSSSSRTGKGKAPAIHPTTSIIPTPKGGLYLYPWEYVLPEEERRKLLDETPREEAEIFLELCTIEQI